MVESAQSSPPKAAFVFHPSLFSTAPLPINTPWPFKLSDLLTSVHAKPSLKHLHQLDLASLQPCYQRAWFHTLPASAGGERLTEPARHN